MYVFALDIIYATYFQSNSWCALCGAFVKNQGKINDSKAFVALD